MPTKKADDKPDTKHGLPQLPSTKDRAGSGGAARSLLVAKSLEDIYQVSPRPARRITTSTSAPSNVANELIVRRNTTRPHSRALHDASPSPPPALPAPMHGLVTAAASQSVWICDKVAGVESNLFSITP